MKLKISSLLTFSALIAAAFFMTTSCKKSNSSTSGGSLSATISGSAWTTTVPTQTTYDHVSGVFDIGGGSIKSGDTTTLGVIIGTPFPLHTVINSDTGNIDIVYANFHTLAGYDGGQQAGHSLVTVSSWDSVNHKIAGTFTGVLYNISGGTDSLVVTNGAFNTSYTVQ